MDLPACKDIFKDGDNPVADVQTYVCLVKFNDETGHVIAAG
mgnify:CR=1 FL=1